MTALTDHRDTLERDGRSRYFTLADGASAWNGGLGAVATATGKLEMASDKTGILVVGRVERRVDSSQEDPRVIVKTGIFKFDNSATHPLAAEHLGKACYVEDDHTLSADGGSHRVVAGTVFAIEADGVWARLGQIVPAAAAVATLTDASGGTSGNDTVAAVSDTASAANAVATLAAKLNALLTSLKNAGVIA